MLFGRFSSSIGYVGVEFLDHDGQVRMLQVRESGSAPGGLHVVGAGVLSVPISESGLPNPAVLAARLRAAISSGGFAGRRCVISLPRSVVQLQAIRLPHMPDQEMKSAVHWEAAQRLNCEPGETVSDFIRTGLPIKTGENREEILLLAAPRAAVSAWVEPLMEAGLRPMAVETAFTALARFCTRQARREVDRDLVSVVLSVTYTGSTLLILRGNSIAFCKPLAIGGHHFDRAVAEHLQLDESAASELRTARMVAPLLNPRERPSSSSGQCADVVAGDPATDRAIYDAVRPQIGELVKEVALCLRYFGVSFRGNPPERIFITGEHALEPRLDEVLSAGCKLPVVIDDAGKTLAHLITQIRMTMNREPGPLANWAAAAGLSLRGMAWARSGQPQGESSNAGEPQSQSPSSALQEART